MGSLSGKATVLMKIFAVAKLLLGPFRDLLLSEGYSHNARAQLDVSLYDLETGTPIKMISDFDELSPAQYRAFQVVRISNAICAAFSICHDAKWI